MPSESAGFKPQKRLHPYSWLFVAAAHLKQMFVPIVVAVVVGSQNQYALWGLLLVIPLVIGALWQQWVYRYDFGPTGVVIHEGLIFRNVRQIDYHRIENIDTERGLLHRMLGVAQVKVETSSGGEPEALIRVLGLDAVTEMREQVFDRKTPVREQRAEPDATETVLLQLPPGELVRFGLIDNRGMIIVAALFGLLAQGGLFEYIEQWAEPVLRHLPVGELAGMGLAMQVLLGLGLLISLIAGVRVLSVVLALVTLFDFTLTRREGDLHARYGLLTRVGLTLRVPRIQAVYQTETLLHRLFKRASLRVDLAGGGGGEQQQNQAGTLRERWLAPICTPETARSLIGEALPHVAFETEPDWQRLAPRTRYRLFRRNMWLWLLLAAGPAIWLTGYWSPLVLAAAAPLVAMHAHLYVRYTRWALTRDAVFFRHGWLNRRLVVAPRNRVQSVNLTENPFDRRYRMARLIVDTAGGNIRGIRIPYLPLDWARELSCALYRGHIPESRARRHGTAACSSARSAR